MVKDKRQSMTSIFISTQSYGIKNCYEFIQSHHHWCQKIATIKSDLKSFPLRISADLTATSIIFNNKSRPTFVHPFRSDKLKMHAKRGACSINSGRMDEYIVLKENNVFNAYFENKVLQCKDGNLKFINFQFKKKSSCILWKEFFYQRPQLNLFCLSLWELFTHFCM